MDRDYVQRLLANAKRREITTVTLPGLGEELHLFTSLTNDEQLRILQAAGTDEDAEARMFTGMLRFMLVDPEGNQLLASFPEAAQFLAVLAADDMAALMVKLNEISTAMAPTPDGGVEVGKAS